jgi:5'(3')-deoxyribonucleotidase
MTVKEPITSTELRTFCQSIRAAMQAANPELWSLARVRPYSNRVVEELEGDIDVYVDFTISTKRRGSKAR